MSALNFNKVELCGRLTTDVELKQSTSARSVIQFSLAVNRPRATDSEQKTDFFRCVAWDKTAEFISKYFHKGESIFICGYLRCNKYKDSVGRLVISTEISVNEAFFVESKKEKCPPPAFASDTSANFEEQDSDGELPF